MMHGPLASELSIQLSCVLLCGLSLLIAHIGTGLDRMLKRYFTAGFLVLVLRSAANIAGLLLRGRPGETVHAALICTNFLEFFFASLCTLLPSAFLLTSPAFTPPVRVKNFFRRTFQFLGAAMIVLLIVNLFTGFLYEIDAQNFYRRGAWFWLTVALNGVILLLDFIYLLSFSRRSFRQKLIPLLLFAMPIIAMPLQLLFYGTSFILMFSTVGIMAMLLYLSNQQMIRYYQKETEIVQLHNTIIQSQIRPHFIYNVLNTIYYLCDADPSKAQEAISTLSDYLRQNFASFQGNQLIPIEQELAHVNNYLALEKLRFEDRLQIETDVQSVSFRLPALTVQPIVENAVKHGLQPKAAGGTVQITVRETDDAFSVTVTDDGMGFDPDAPLPQDRAHIGIANVRAQLDAIGGSLTVRSALGEGTVATLHVPKAITPPKFPERN